MTTPIFQSTQLSIEELQTQLKVLVGNNINNIVGQLTMQFNGLYKTIWENKSLTPQQVFDAFGSEGVKLFVVANAFASAINSLTGTESVPTSAPYAWTQANGVVTIGNKIL